MSKTDEFCCEPLLLPRYEVGVLGLFPKTGTFIGNLSERTLKSEQLYLQFGFWRTYGTASIYSWSLFFLRDPPCGPLVPLRSRIPLLLTYSAVYTIHNTAEHEFEL